MQGDKVGEKRDLLECGCNWHEWDCKETYKEYKEWKPCVLGSTVGVNGPAPSESISLRAS